MKNVGKFYKKVLERQGWKCLSLQKDSIVATRFYRFGEITAIINFNDRKAIDLANKRNLPVYATMDNSVVMMTEMKINDSFTWDEKIKIMESFLRSKDTAQESDTKISLSEGFIFYTDIYFQVCPDDTTSKKQQVKDVLEIIHEDFLTFNHDIAMAERRVKQPATH